MLTDSTYVVELLLRDKLGLGVVYTDYIDTVSVFFKANEGGTAAGLGKPPERDNVLDIAWDLQVRGNLYIGPGGKMLADFVTEDGTTIAGEVTWRYRKWNSGRIEMWSRPSIESGAFSGDNVDLCYSGIISVPIPFTLSTYRSYAFVSIHSSGIAWATTVGAWEENVRFRVGRMYGDKESIPMTVQIYVSGYLA